MMSALDSVTKRRALVVAAVGSPPSSSTISFSGTPPISFGTKSSALRSGMPSAAAGPVVESEMPMVISLVCACADDARQRKSCCERRSGESGLLHSFLPADMFFGFKPVSRANSAPSLGMIRKSEPVFREVMLKSRVMRGCKSAS